MNGSPVERGAPNRSGGLTPPMRSASSSPVRTGSSAITAASIPCSAGSDPSKCVWRPPPRKSAGRSACASRCSTRRCRPRPSGAALISRRDVDAYDAICDHLLVLDHDVKPKPFRHCQAEGGGHLPASAPGRGEPPWRLLHARRIRHRSPAPGSSRSALPGTRPLLRAQALSQQAHGRAALARDLDLRAAPPHRRDDRLRQPGGHATRSNWRCP